MTAPKPGSPRALLGQILTAALPDDILVEPYARDGIVPVQTTVMLRLDEGVRTPEAPIGHRTYAWTLILVAATSDPHGIADNELDDALEQVLHVIETSPTLPMWTRFRRGVYGTQTERPAYEITLTVTHKKQEQ